MVLLLRFTSFNFKLKPSERRKFIKAAGNEKRVYIENLHKTNVFFDREMATEFCHVISGVSFPFLISPPLQTRIINIYSMVFRYNFPRYKMIRRDNTVHINNASQGTKNNKRDPYVHKMASKLLFLIFLHYLPDRFSLTIKTSSRRSVLVFNL